MVIKVSDEGGGISRSNMERIWSYLYTTANPRVLESMLNNDDGEIKVSHSIYFSSCTISWLGVVFFLYTLHWGQQPFFLISNYLLFLQDFDTSTPLAGLGCGLPIARNYARSFNGELTIMSMEGYGTDSFIYLPRLNSKDEQKV